MSVSVIDISRALTGAEFPADKEQLVLRAMVNGAPEEVIEAIEQLERPAFRSIIDVEAQFT